MSRTLALVAVAGLLLFAPLALGSGSPTVNETDSEEGSEANATDANATIEVGDLLSEQVVERLEPFATTADAPPALGTDDPWVDANGDEMFGALEMGPNVIRLNGRALAATVDGDLQFDGDSVCLQDAGNCEGQSISGDTPIVVDGSTILLSTQGCADGEFWKWTGSTWDCQADLDTTYDGSDFALSDQACASGEVVAGVDASGNVACVTDQDTDSDTLADLSCASTEITRYDGSTWICSTDQDTTYDGSDFALSDQACASGEVVAGVDASGNVACVEDATETTSSVDWSNVTDKPAGFADDVDNDTTYDGSDFALSDQACASGEVVAGVDASGNVACVTDQDSDSDTLAELNCSGDEIARWVDTDGDGTADAWACSLDRDTTYTAGDGLELDGTTFDLVQACSSDQVLKWDGSSSSWVCRADEDTDTTYQAGEALELDTSTSPDSFQLTTACSSGEVLKQRDVDGDGTADEWACETDQDTDSDTLAELDCASDEIARWTDTDGDGTADAWACAIDRDTDTTYQAGESLELDTTTSPDSFQMTTACSSGQVLKQRDVDGDGSVDEWACELDEDTDTNAGAGAGLAWDGSGNHEVNAGGGLSISSDAVVANAGDGLTITGDNVALTQACSSDQILKYDGSSWACSIDEDTTVDAWLLGGNAGTTSSDFLGTTDYAPLVIKVDGTRGYAIEPTLGTPNILGGDGSNTALFDQGLTIAGGKDNQVGRSIEEICDDSTDNDGDGAIDESECSKRSNFAGVSSGRSNVAGLTAGTEICNDSLDNDGDGWVDEDPCALSGKAAAVAGGVQNTANNTQATVGGGAFNTASGFRATVSGGDDNTANATQSTIGGGAGNTATDIRATVSGGVGNAASAIRATVGGGAANTADNYAATVGGGEGNTASGIRATVGGGMKNTADDYAATVPGGRENNASGSYSFAAGAGANATHSGAFVWSDRTDTAENAFRSTDQNQFLIDASGGVGIGTNSPSHELDVDGTITASDALFDDFVSVGHASGSDKDPLYFDVGAEKLQWNDVLHQFELSDALNLTGPGSIRGEILSLEAVSDHRYYFDTDDTSSSRDLDWLANASTFSNADQVMDLDEDGNLGIGGTLSTNAFDVAESYRQAEPVSEGELVRVDPADPTAVKKADAEHPGVIGIVSTEPGVLLGGAPASVEQLGETWGPDAVEDYETQRPVLEEEVLADNPELAERIDAGNEEAPHTLEELTLERFSEDYLAPVALSGRVPTQASTTNGPIEAGDTLTVSEVPGVAEKADPGDPVVGTALESLEVGTGTIEVFVSSGPGNADVSELETKVADQQEQIDQLETENEQLAEENQELRERLDAIEERLDAMEE